MKKLIFISAILLSMTASAGKIKELVIETDDAISYEMYNNADLSVESIDNHQLGMNGDLVTVTADVTTRNPHNGRIGSWTCTVSFEKIANVFEFKDIECD